MVNKLDSSHSNKVERTLEQAHPVPTQKDSTYLSTIMSCPALVKTEKSLLSAIFSSLLYLWNLIFNTPSLPNIKREKIERDTSTLVLVKRAIKGKNLPAFNEAYGNLSNDTKKILQNIHYQWMIKNDANARYVSVEKYIRSHPFHPSLESSCDQAINKLSELLSLKPFVDILRISNLTTDSVTDEIKCILNQFELLPHPLRERIKYTIWKVLKPQNNYEATFGETILKSYAADPFIQDVLVAVVKGLKKTDDYEQWHLEMPKGWESRKKFTVY